MIQRKRVHVKFFFVQHTATVSAGKLPDGQTECKLKIGRAECRVQKNFQALRAEDIERSFTPVEMKCAEQAGNAVQMVTVKVTDEDRMDAAPPDARAHELHLCSLAAIEQKNVAFADQRSR